MTAHRITVILAALFLPVVGLCMPMVSPSLADAIPLWSYTACAVTLAVFSFRPGLSKIPPFAIGVMLVAVANHQSPLAGRHWDAVVHEKQWPQYDLTQQNLPKDAHGYVSVFGYLRQDMTLDEYRVVDGKRPDQNEQAEYRLVPMVGTTDDTVDTTGRILIARVLGKKLIRSDKPMKLRGRLEPLAPELLSTMVQLGPGHDNTSGILLNTTNLPLKGEVVSALGICLLSGLVGFMLLGGLRRQRTPTAS